MQTAKLSQLFQQGIAFLQKNQFTEAKTSFTQILRHQPSHADALLYLAVIAGREGALSVSETLLTRLIAAHPQHAQAHYNLAVTLTKQEKYPEAETALRQVIRCAPQMKEAYINLSHVLTLQSRFIEAIEVLHEALKQQPGHPALLHQLGLCYQQAGNFVQGMAAFREVLIQDPHHLPAILSLVQLYRSQQQEDAAVQLLQEELQHTPQNADLLKELADMMRETGNLAEACQLYQQTLANRPSAGTYLNLGVTLQAAGKPEEAIQAYSQAYQLDPNPGILGNRSQAILLSGDLERGFQEYEWRTQTHEQKPLFAWSSHKPRWKGDFFSGKRLLVHHEQGLGDNLQFVRYLPMVKERGGIVILSTKKALVRLFQNCAGIDYVVEHTDEVIRSLEYDCVIPLMSLPAVFGTTLRSIPAPIPYIVPDSALVQNWEKKITSFSIPATQRKVGLVWAGSGDHTAGWNRNLPPALLTSLNKIPNTVYFSLQLGKGADAAGELASQLPFYDLTSHIHDFADTAALISHLDLIISTDTAVPHLAGAMGKPVWLALPYAAEWRWLLHRSDTPWYPTMRLFRQPVPGAWDQVIQQITTELSR